MKDIHEVMGKVFVEELSHEDLDSIKELIKSVSNEKLEAGWDKIIHIRQGCQILIDATHNKYNQED